MSRRWQQTDMKPEAKAMTPWWKCLHHEVHDLPPAGFTLTSVTVYTPESTWSSIFMHCCSPRLSRLQFAEFLLSSGHRYTSPVCFFPVDSKGAPTSNLQPRTQFESQTLFIMQKSRILEKEGLVFEARTPYRTGFIWLDIQSRAVGLLHVHFIIQLTKLMTFKYLWVNIMTL